MARLDDLYDDFLTVGLDRSKWTTTYAGADTLATGGLKITLPTTINQYQEVDSVAISSIVSSGMYARIDQVPTSSSLASCAMIFVSQSVNTTWYGWTYDNGTLYAQTHTGTTVVNRFSVPYNPSQHLWWRVQQQASTIIWSVSANGLSFTTVCKVTFGAIQDGRVVFNLGYYGAGASGDFRIGLFNTLQPINRGPGYLTDNFDTTPTGNVLVQKDYGNFYTLDDGGTPANVAIVGNTGGRCLQLNAPTGQVNLVRTNMRTKIKDLDFTVSVKPISQTSGTSSTDAETPQIVWRYVDNNNHYRLHIFRDYLLLYKVVGGTISLLRYIAIGTQNGTTYKFRVIHIGSLIVLYRDSGDFATTNVTSIPYEIARLNDSGLVVQGHVAFRIYQGKAQYDNLSILPATIPPAVPTTFPMKKRLWGAFAASANPTTGVITSMLDNTSILTNLETAVNRKMDVASWFIDNNAAYPLAAAKTFADGGRDNLFSWGPEGWSFASILAGTRDTYLNAMADGCKATGRTVYIRLMAEMNGSWHGYSLLFDPTTNGVSPSLSCSVASYAQFIQVWRYIVNLFAARTSNVKWVFCINETDEPRNNTWEKYYPGDQYVDIIGFDSYNWGNSFHGTAFNWREHDEIFRDPYNRMAGLYNKPIWVCEFASKEPLEDDRRIPNGSGGFVVDVGGAPIDPAHSKGAWVTSLMEDTGYSKVTGLIYFSIQKERDWRMDSSSVSTAAFVKGFTTAAAPQVGTYDPVNFPLPIPYGWASTNPVGKYEYMYLTEDNYAPLQIEPSYGGIWLAAADLGYAGPREDTDNKVEQSGLNDYTKFSGSKAVTLNFQIIPYLGCDTVYMTELIARWSAPSRRPTLVYKMFGQDERQIRLRGDSLGRATPINLRDYSVVQASWVAYDGYETSTNQQTATLGSNDSGVVVNMGSAMASPLINLYGPLTNPIVFNDTMDSVDSSARLGLTTTIDAGQFIQLDVANRSVQLNGWDDPSASRRSLLTTVRWFNLAIFNNTIRTQTDNTGDTGTVQIVFNDTWA